MMSIQTQRMSNIIDLNVISYRDLVRGSPGEAAKLFQSASVDGFLQLDLAGSLAQASVLDVLPAVYKAGERYFAQPAAIKEQDRRRGDLTDRGFLTSVCDETLEISYDEHRAGKILFPAVFEAERVTIGSFMETLDHACRVMLRSLSTSLDMQGLNSLEGYHEKSDTSESGLKFISEPTLSRLADVSDNLHTDGGTFTIIFCEELGLQAYFPSIQRWAFIPPKPSCCIVNVADALNRFSNGRLHSPKHRVTQLHDGAGQRLYLSYFLRPNHVFISK